MSIDFAPRVAAGATLLDEAQPGWAEDIDLPALDVSTLSYCVLGQVFGDFEVGLVRLGFDVDDEGAAIAHGFSMSVLEFDQLRREMGASAYDTPTVFGPLTEEWKKLISARLSASDPRP